MPSSLQTRRSKKDSKLLQRKELYGDGDVMAHLNNCVVAMYRWTRNQPVLADRPQRLRKFAEGIVEMVTEAVTEFQAPQGGGRAESLQILSDSEIMLCLQLAVMLVLVKGDVLPADNPFNATMLGAVVAKLKVPIEDDDAKGPA